MSLYNPFDDTQVRQLSSNTVDVTLTLSASEAIVGGVCQVSLNYSAHNANIGGNWYRVNAGAVLLNSGHELLPTNYYVFSQLINGVPVVVAAITNPEDIPALNYEYSWVSIVRLKSAAGVATIYYIRRAFCANNLLLHYNGEYDLNKIPIWASGGAISINATNGAVSMEELEYRRLRFEAEVEAITNGVMVLADETTTHANLETVTTYLDDSDITAGKYHKVLLGAIISITPAYPFVLIRQSKPTTEYATLDEAVSDSERVAATSFPLAYRGMVFPLAYVVMLKGDASDLTTVDLRSTGIIGSGGGGGGAITDHDTLLNLGTTSHDKYLLIDGSRDLTGNMAVDDGVTIDGVDLSIHAANANAHHNAVSLGVDADTLLGLSTQQLTLDNQTANRVFAGPETGAAGVPTFRALVAADIPNVTAEMPYAMASDSTTQGITSVASAQVITFNTSEVLSGITRTSTSRYTIITAGTYLITFSGIANLAATPGDKHLEMWLRVGGVDVARSNTRVQITNASTAMTLAVSFLYTFAAGQYFELWTWGDDTDCQWLATAAATGPTRPAVPSVIMTVNMVSK